jgi:hypothetical protein
MSTARSVAGEEPATHSTPLLLPLDDTAGPEGLETEPLHQAVASADPLTRRAMTPPLPEHPARVPRPGANT